jgi:hypothetical protein
VPLSHRSAPLDDAAAATSARSWRAAGAAGGVADGDDGVDGDDRKQASRTMSKAAANQVADILAAIIPRAPPRPPTPPPPPPSDEIVRMPDEFSDIELSETLDPRLKVQLRALLLEKFEDVRYVTSTRRPEDVLAVAAEWRCAQRPRASRRGCAVVSCVLTR